MLAQTTDIQVGRLALGYLLLLIPLGICLWYRVPLVKQTLLGAVRMTAQLVLVGFYLDVIFDLNNPWLTALWLLVMVAVADVSVLRHCGFRLKPFVGPLFVAMMVGVGLPALMFLLVILDLPHVMEPRFLIPIAGMTLGNCLRANIIGIGRFYKDIHREDKAYLLSLAQGANLGEAVFPYLRSALQAALAPTLATMATIGLVSLPGMMTGVILGGQSPLPAIKYQIAIMLSIFSGTALTILVTIQLTLPKCFDGYGILDRRIFKQ